MLLCAMPDLTFCYSQYGSWEADFGLMSRSLIKVGAARLLTKGSWKLMRLDTGLDCEDPRGVVVYTYVTLCKGYEA